MSTPARAASPVTVCTLWEGDYHKGLGALANSLVAAGYRGTLWAGYRGTLPHWALAGKTTQGIHLHPLTAELDIAFVPYPGTRHLTLCKSAFMADVLNHHDPQAAGIYYFDPDIFLLADWSFFEEWLESGVAVCEDASHPISPAHPRVTAWLKLAARCGLAPHHPAQAYLNGGLIGLTRADATTFLEQWALLLSTAEQQYGFAAILQIGTRTHPFHSTDQDALNIAAMTFPGPISRIGPDGMGFSQGEWLTIHAIQTKKPWRRRLFYDWLTQGVEIERGTRIYWRFSNGPARIEPAWRIRLHRLLLPLVALLSRFYRRR